jgi:hypothetical protein
MEDRLTLKVIPRIRLITQIDQVNLGLQLSYLTVMEKVLEENLK